MAGVHETKPQPIPENYFHEYPLRSIERTLASFQKIRHKLASIPVNEMPDYVESLYDKQLFDRCGTALHLAGNPSEIEQNVWLGLSQKHILSGLLPHFPTDPAQTDRMMADFALDNLHRIWLDNLELPTSNRYATTIIHPYALNPVTHWFIDRAYEDIDQTLGQIADKPFPPQTIDALIVLGVIYDKFSSVSELTAYNKQQLRPFVTINSPALVKEYLDFDRTQVEQSQLQVLQQYWRRYCEHYMVQSRLGVYNNHHLSLEDRVRTERVLGPDNRSFDDLSTAERHASYTQARRDESSDSMAADRLEEYKLHQLGRRSRQRVIQSTDEVLTCFNPHHRGFIDSQGQLHPHYQGLAAKANLILSRFIAGQRYLSDAGNIAGLARLRDELYTISGKGFEANPGSPPALQIAALIFPCLTLSKHSKVIEAAIHLISFTLQPLLAYPLNEPVPKPSPNGLTPNFLAYALSSDEVKVKKFLRRLTVDDEVVGLDNLELKAMIDQRIIARKDALLLPNKTDVPLTVFNYVGLMAALVVNLNAGHHAAMMILSESMKPTESAVISFLTTTFFNIMFSISAPPQLTAMHTRKFIRKLQPREKDFEASLQRLQANFKERQHQLFTWFYATVATSLMFGFGVISAVKLDLLKFGEQTRTAAFGLDGIALALGMPDAIDAETAETMENERIARILHLPDSIKAVDGTQIGFMPETIIGEGGVRMHTGELHTHPPDIYIESVASVAAVDYTAASDELVYEYVTPPEVIFPIDGYRINRVFYEDGWEPTIGPLGEIDFQSDTAIPKRVRVVAEPLQTAKMTTAYNPTKEDPFWYLKALEHNQQLSSDPELQELHSQMITKIHSINRFIPDTDTENLHKWQAQYTKAAKQYTREFFAVMQKRFYSLKTATPAVILNDTMPNLTTITADPTRGFYCTVANAAFREFMSDIQVTVLNQAGSPLRYYGGDAYSRIGHMNSVVIYPNGEMEYIDMTPSIPTPGEDFSSLDERAPLTPRQMVERLIEVAAGVTMAGIALGNRKRIRERLRKKTLAERIATQLPHDPTEANQILNAVEHVITYTMEAGDPKKLAHDAVRLLSTKRIYPTKSTVAAPTSDEARHQMKQQILQVVQNLPTSCNSLEYQYHQDYALYEQKYIQISIQLEQTMNDMEYFSETEETVRKNQINTLNRSLLELEAKMETLDYQLSQLKHTPTLSRVLKLFARKG